MQKIFKKFISNRDVEFLDSSLFAVVTITPYFPKKEVNTYIMDRVGIEGFLKVMRNTQNTVSVFSHCLVAMKMLSNKPTHTSV